MPYENWGVYRQDFTGNEFLVEQNLSEQQAKDRVAEFESHKHHQHYWAAKIPDSDVDFCDMLQRSLDAGSSMDASLKVLRNQKASAIDCIKAVRHVQNISLGESKQIVLNHPAFSDQNESRDALHDAIELALRRDNET